MKPTNQSGERRPCRGCGAPITFMADIEGKLHPLDSRAPTWLVERDAFGHEVAVRSEALVSHFSVCPKADEFSKMNREVNAKK